MCLTNLVEHNIDTSSTNARFGHYSTLKNDWSALVVLVGKTDGTLRFCVDFRELNAINKKDAFPLPLIDQILDCLEGAQFYSSLDIAAGFWQEPLTESTRPKAAFSTSNGDHYEYTIGLCNAPAYKTTPAKLAEIKKQVQQMLDLDIIQPSKNDWSALVVLVGKKDGTLCFCVDFRELNAINKKDAFPLPLIDQILDCLEGAQFYSSLDIAAGFWQEPLTESTRPKTAFSTSNGDHYEYTIGLCNAPAAFQCLINQSIK